MTQCHRKLLAIFYFASICQELLLIFIILIGFGSEHFPQSEIAQIIKLFWHQFVASGKKTELQKI